MLLSIQVFILLGMFYIQQEKMDVYLVNKSGFGFLYSSQNRTDQSDPYIMMMMNVQVT